MTLSMRQHYRHGGSFGLSEHHPQDSAVCAAACHTPRVAHRGKRRLMHVSAWQSSVSHQAACHQHSPQRCMHMLTGSLQQLPCYARGLSSIHHFQAGSDCLVSRGIGRSARSMPARMQTSSAAGISSTSTATLTQAALQQADLSQLEGKLKIIGEASKFLERIGTDWHSQVKSQLCVAQAPSPRLVVHRIRAQPLHIRHAC